MLHSRKKRHGRRARLMIWPTKAPRPPSGAMWLHEIKHDGFRVIARKDGARVKLYSRPGNDLTWRFSLIVESLGRPALAILHHRWRSRRM
jgi:ATP-dependent DNA ligase